MKFQQKMNTYAYNSKNQHPIVKQNKIYLIITLRKKIIIKKSKRIIKETFIVVQEYTSFLGFLHISMVLSGLIINLIYAKIIKKQVTVGMEMHVNFCMIEVIINSD